MKKTSLAKTLESARVIVCAGTGGVGKTTIAAALGLHAALCGRRTLVLTIDPARRLADALGLKDLTSEAAPVDLTELAPAKGKAGSAGSLAAMMLDPKPTFDGLVERYAKDTATRDRILENRIYRQLSAALAGSAEYAAMIQVHELFEAGEYELIIVDTPPADHALDFLRAPRRMREFLESRFVRTLARPAATASLFGARLIGQGLQRIFSLIERVAGGGFLEDIAEFLNAVNGLSLGLDDRSKRVEDLLLGPESGFVLISGADGRGRTAAVGFLAELDTFEVPLVAIIANRLRPWPLDAPPSSKFFDLCDAGIARDAQTLSAAIGEPGTGEAIVERLADYTKVCQSQEVTRAALERLATERGVDFRAVRELSGEIDRLRGIESIASMLVTGRKAARKRTTA